MTFGPGYWFCCLLALVAHEAAHIAMARALDVRIVRLGVSLKGPYIVREPGERWQNICISLAGPALNLLIAAFYWDLAPELALVNLLLGVYNLLPVPHSDGRRVWQAILQQGAVGAGRQ